MRKKILYWLVGFAAFFIVFEHVQAIAYDVWEWWDDRSYSYTPTYDSVAAPDAVERPIQKVRPDIDGTLVKPRVNPNGEPIPRRYLVVPTHVQHAAGSIDAGDSDLIIVTGQKRSGSLPQGLRLPKRDDRPKNSDGTVTLKTRHSVQRSCSGDSYSNLLLHDRLSKTTKPIFDVPLSVIGHQLVQSNDETSHILTFTAILDTSQDDQLTCQDFIHMAIFDVKTGSLHWVDMGGSEPLVSQNTYGRTTSSILRKLSLTEYVIGIGVDENDDGLFDPKSEITEMAILNILDKTFEKIVTTEDLLEVQKILYPEILQ